MTFILKPNHVQNHWKITSLEGNTLVDSKYFQNKEAAVNWAMNFISSWNGATLIVEE